MSSTRQPVRRSQEHVHITVTILMIIIATALSPAAAAETPVTPDNLFDLSIEQLMEIPVVVSASRTEQELGQSAVPVSVLTHDDIHYSGVTNIPDILRFVPGVDVRRLDRTRYSVGVRGLLGQFSDRTLVLINGRNALDPVFGTAEWLHFPLFMEDIEQIEVVRGPGGAVWGANAYTGVINIITKKPGPDLNNLFSTTVSEFGDTYTHLRLADQKDRWSWRISAGYEDAESSDAAGAGRMDAAFPDLNPLIGFDAFKPRDFFRSWKFDSEFENKLDDDTLVRFGIAHSSARFGDREAVGFFPRQTASSEITRLFARLEHQFDNDDSLHLQWYGNYAVRHLPHITARYDYYENDLEAQYNFTPHDDHDVSVGGNLRWLHTASSNDQPVGEIVFRESAFDEYWAGLFAVDRWALTDRLTLETQARLDRYSGTHSDWSARSALLYALDDRHDHIVRVGASRGFRNAGLMVRQTSLASFSAVPGLLPPMFTFLPPAKELKNETTYALEAGYSGKLSDRLTLRIDAYYQRMEHFIGARSATVDMLGVPITTTTYENQRGANAYGAESELTYAFNNADLTAWVASNQLTADDDDADLRAYRPARYKAGLRLRYAIEPTLTLAANYAYNTALRVNDVSGPFEDAEAFSQLDLTLAKAFPKNAGELMLGVSDLFNQTQGPIYDINTFTTFETPGRTFFLRLQLYF